MLSDEQIGAGRESGYPAHAGGGLWAIDAATAWDIAKNCTAKVVIPMHFRDDRCDFPVASVDDF